jgi:arylformamidase
MQIDLEAEYNNRARVPEHPALIAGWARDAALYRTDAANRQRVISYGPTQRQTIDIFDPIEAKTGAMPVLFIHGGYWQGLDPSFFSHMAKGLNAHGVSVGVAGYDLCPDVSVGTIIEQMIAAAQALHRTFHSPVVASGHSAGGHLAACLAATDWEAIDPDLPERMVPAGLAISGLFELEPLVPTSVNAKLGLDIPAARSFSPRLWTPPSGISFDVWVGGAESPEYLRQSASINAVWAAAGNMTQYEEVADANHFTVIAGLADPNSAMTLRLAKMAGAGTT